MTRPSASLRRRLMWAFALYTVVVAGLFGLYAATFMYSVEDGLLEAALDQEADLLLHDHAVRGEWGAPRAPWIRRYASSEAFPPDLREAREHEPWRREFAGLEGRHYHVQELVDDAGRPHGWLVAEVSDQLVVRPMREEAFGLMLATALVLLALALGVAAWLAHRTAGPLAALAADIDGLDPADLAVDPSRGFRDDEVGVLARGLAGLTERLRAFVAREREFTGDVSHELRTPLAVIRSATERLLARTDLDGEAREGLQHVQQSGLQLQHTIDLLLSLARECGSRSAPPVPLLPILERVVVDQAALATGCRVTVDIDVPPDTQAELPEALLRSLLTNLVGNAMAHGSEGRLAISVVDGEVVVCNPVDPATAPTAFDGRRDGGAGNGLGLGIVRRLCERHGIALAVDRKGDRVIARFPLRSTPE